MGLRRFESDSDDEEDVESVSEGLDKQQREFNEEGEDVSVSFSETESEEESANREGAEKLAVLLDELDVPEASKLIKRESSRTA